MYKLFIYIIVLISLILPFTAAAGYVPDAAQEMAEEIDEQILRQMDGNEFDRSSVTLAITVPVTLADLEVSSQLGLQMGEEMAQSFSKLGYRVLEIRKAQTIQMIKFNGEMVLTRDVSKLAEQSAFVVAVLAGTYVVTSDNVRFNMKVLRATNNEVLGASSFTVPLTAEVASLLPVHKVKAVPSVLTRLP